MVKLVSAIITTYRRDSQILNRAIRSVLNQTYKNIELIVVDDNGIDSKYHNIVKQTVNSYSNENIKLISNEKNTGVQKSRNRGIDASNGE